MTNRAFVILFGLLTVIFVGAIGAGVWVVTQSRQADGEGNSLVGGPFQLTDHTGQSVTEADYDGVHKIVYFGYTTCPDVCPTGLSLISEALEEIGPGAKSVKPLFITIDPERDTVTVMAGYHQHFHPSFSNLTGTPEQIAAVAKAYRVFYKKTVTEGSDYYLMDHSVITYLMAPGGGFLAHFGPETTPKQLADAIRALL